MFYNEEAKEDLILDEQPERKKNLEIDEQPTKVKKVIEDSNLSTQGSLTSLGIKEAFANPHTDLFNGGKCQVNTIIVGELNPQHKKLIGKQSSHLYFEKKNPLVKLFRNIEGK